MCGHVFMYRDFHQLQRHRPVWRCSTCGREAYVPLDCCTRPDFAPRPYVTLVGQCTQKLVTMGRWALASLGVLLDHYRRPVVPSGMVFDDDYAEGVAVEARVVGGDDDTETVVTEDESVTVGGSV